MNNTDNEPQDERIHTIVTNTLRVLFTIIGLIGNCLVIAVISTKKKRKTSNDIFLLNLACADLSYIVFHNALIAHYYIGYSSTSLFYCKFIYPLMSVPFSAGIFTITVMSSHRCRVILNPYRPKTRTCWINVCVLMTWVLSVLILLPTSIVSTNVGMNCLATGWSSEAQKIYTAFITFVQYPIPLLVIIVAYTRIGYYLSKPRIPRASVIARGNTLRSPRDETRKESIQITKTVGVIVLLFVVLMLPLQVAMEMSVMAETAEPWTDLLWSYGDVLATLHSSLNPFVYSARTRQYRSQIKSWITRQRRRSSSTSEFSGASRTNVVPACNDENSDEHFTAIGNITIHLSENKTSAYDFPLPGENGNQNEFKLRSKPLVGDLKV